MFNLSNDSSAQPITPRQAAYLGRLIGYHGKPAFQAAKQRAGVPVDITAMRLSKRQASKVIDELKKARA